MSRGSKEEIFGERVFRGVSTFFGKVVFKQSPIFPREVAYTPTFTGFGTVSAVNFTWTRVGNRIYVMGKFTCGVSTAVEARMSLPGSLISDAALIPSIEYCGRMETSDVGFFTIDALIESGAAYVTFGLRNAALSGLTKANGNALAGNGVVCNVKFDFGISGWNV